MKKSLGGLLAGLALTGGYVLMGPLTAQNVGDIFVPEDTDAFDPGLPIGAQFPQIRALYEGREITDIDQFMGEKGAVFFANRSVDW
jgi:hypothetical protein